MSSTSNRRTITPRSTSAEPISGRPSRTRRRDASEMSSVVVLEPVPEGSNIVILRGHLSRVPEHRALASGSALLSADLTVRPADGPTETIPLVWFDPPDRALRLDQGDDVVAVGRVRRRFFRSGGATLSRTEVVVSAIVSARAPARIRAAVSCATAGLTPSE